MLCLDVATDVHLQWDTCRPIGYYRS